MFKSKKAKATLNEILFDFVEVREKLLQFYAEKQERVHEIKDKQKSLAAEEIEIGAEIDRTQWVIKNINNLLGEKD